jgi:hypothetical protein
LWGHVLAKWEALAITYADDGYIKAKLSVELQVFAELKHVLKLDACLELKVSKTSVLPKGTTHQAVFDVAHSILAACPALTHRISPSLLSVLKVSLVSMCLLVLY